MSRLRTLPNRLKPLPSRVAVVQSMSEQRITGRPLQSRRWRMWQADPHCASCRRVVAFPGGFELDHIVALANGGADSDANCQLLCHECHALKTTADLGRSDANGSRHRRRASIVK